MHEAWLLVSEIDLNNGLYKSTHTGSGAVVPPDHKRGAFATFGGEYWMLNVDPNEGFITLEHVEQYRYNIWDPVANVRSSLDYIKFTYS